MGVGQMVEFILMEGKQAVVESWLIDHFLSMLIHFPQALSASLKMIYILSILLLHTYMAIYNNIFIDCYLAILYIYIYTSKI